MLFIMFRLLSSVCDAVLPPRGSHTRFLHATFSLLTSCIFVFRGLLNADSAEDPKQSFRFQILFSPHHSMGPLGPDQFFLAC